MGFALEMIVYLLIMTLMSVTTTLGYADGKNATYIEVAATEAFLKEAPFGYATPQIQQDIKDFLQQTRGMDPSLVIIGGTTDITQRKVRGSADETILLTISYPRQTLLFFGGIQTSKYHSKRTIKTEYTGT